MACVFVCSVAVVPVSRRTVGTLAASRTDYLIACEWPLHDCGVSRGRAGRLFLFARPGANGSANTALGKTRRGAGQTEPIAGGPTWGSDGRRLAGPRGTCMVLYRGLL